MSLPSLFLTAGHSATDPTHLPPLPTFSPAVGSASGLDILAAATMGQPSLNNTRPTTSDGAALPASLHSAGPYNPAASLPPKVVKKTLALEFVEMAELRGDVWFENSVTIEPNNPICHSNRLPVYQDLARVLCSDGLHACDQVPRERPRALGLPDHSLECGPQL